MKLALRHPFACTPDAYWRSYWDPEFDAVLQKTTGISREVISEEVVDGLRVRRQRFTWDKPLPGPAASTLGTDKLQYDQVSRIDDARKTIAWEVLSPVMPDKIKASGTVRVEATPDGCVQILDGNVSVGIFMLGGQMEKLIADNLTKAQDGTAVMRRKWLLEHP